MSDELKTQARQIKARLVDRKGFEKMIDVEFPPPSFVEIGVRTELTGFSKMTFVLRHQFVDHVEYREDGF